MEENPRVTGLSPKTDICSELVSRYGNSSASQHKHLIAVASASKQLLLSESLPLSPLSYFVAGISSLSSPSLDPDEISALATFLAIVLPLVPKNAILPEKAAETVGVVCEVIIRRDVSSSSVRGLVKCLGDLLGFCDFGDWSQLEFGFRKLLQFSVDSRPKVRKCAQACVVNVFKSLESSTLRKEAGKLVLSMFKDYMPLALEISHSKALNGSEDEKSSKPEHLDVIHMLTLLKHVVSYLPNKVSLKVLQQLYKLMNYHCSPLMRHILGVIEEIIESSEDDFLISEGQGIIKSLASYVSFGGEEFSEVLLSAAELLKRVLVKFPSGGESKRITYLSLVVGSIVNLLNHKANTSSRASEILKELIRFHINSELLTIVKESFDDESKSNIESNALKSTCASFESMLTSCPGTPNEHALAVISTMFRELGDLSYLYMKGIIFKLADMMNLACENKSDTDHLQECVGSAVCAIGPKKILTIIPINVNKEDLTCSSAWLIPILKIYVSGSSLELFMEHFVPLAESFQKLSAKALKSGIQTDLQELARAVWGLLPAFCNYPSDTHQNFSSLAEIFITLLRKDSYMLENIAVALRQLVNQNKSALNLEEVACELTPLGKTSELKDSSIDVKCAPSYTKKIAHKNMKALESCSRELLQALIDVFFDSSTEERVLLKDVIGSLASITDSSVTKTIFVSSLERLGLKNEELDSFSCGENNAKIKMALELASAFVEGSTEDLIALIFKLIKETLQEGDMVTQSEAYHTLAKILDEQPMFCSSHVNELAVLLLGLKPPVESRTLTARLACFQNLLVHSIRSTSEEENPKAFLVLNEIILTIKDSNEEVRKAAYDMLIGLSSKLQKLPNATPDAPLNKLINMIMGYLSAPSPQIKSGAVSALSILVYNNAETCVMETDLIPSILALLKNKALEVIKAVLGFVKVLVSCQPARDLENLLPDIVNSILPWSPVSRNHFREKVIVIVEIMIRKCGSAKVESFVPDKYKSFLKSVQENRHGKQRSKETSATDLDSELPESSPNGNQLHKRKHDGSGFQRQVDNTMKKPRFSNWDRKGKGFVSRKNEMHGNGANHVKNDEISNSDRKFKRQSLGNTRNTGRDFKRESNNKKPSRRFGEANNRPDPAMKFAKHKKVGRKP